MEAKISDYIERRIGAIVEETTDGWISHPSVIGGIQKNGISEGRFQRCRIGSLVPRQHHLGCNFIRDGDLDGNGSLARADGHRSAPAHAPDFGRIFDIDGAAAVASSFIDRDWIT
jgi:hypothetical protein